jgi:acetyl coenzyme A synthetase (ADP forming)-like protein
MADLNLFFNPTSIAVIGASRTPGKIGYAILENLKITFTGKLFPINPQATEILGLNSYPSVLSIEEPVDLAVIVTPAETVKNILVECIKKKIKAAIIISSGFSEIGEKERELELKNASKGKIRIIGPNCVGIFQKGMDMMFFPRERLKRPSDGYISHITQSGAVGSTLLDIIASEGVGVAKFISIGNKIDVDEVELLAYLEKDVATRAIALYVESINRGKEFVEIAKRIVPKKPIVALKAGKTKKGQEAVLSHTGALAGPAEIYSAAFKQAGIIEAKTTEELFDFSKALANQPALNDNRIAIVTDGGGYGILATDAAVQAGLDLPQLSDNTVKALKSVLPPHGIAKNPVDLTGDATTERYQTALEAVFKDKNVSAVLIIILMQIPTINDGLLDVIRDCKMYGKPFVVCATGGQWIQERARKLESWGVPVYDMPERAVKALAALAEYGKILKKK